MNNQQLQTLTNQISIKYFGKEFNYPVTFNNRLRTTGGRYFVEAHNIDINPKFYQQYGKDMLVSIIKHELCHYFIHLAGGYNESAHGKHFMTLLKKVGGSRYVPRLAPKHKQSNTLYYYGCQDCHHVYIRLRRMNTNKYVCGYCHGRLVQLNHF